jgi:uridylate kinase
VRVPVPPTFKDRLVGVTVKVVVVGGGVVPPVTVTTHVAALRVEVSLT